MSKILYFDFNLPYLIKDANHPVGGATVEWYAWIKGFTANNHKVGVLTWKGATEYIGKPTECDILESYNPKGGIPRLNLLYKYPSILNTIKQYQPDYLVQECMGPETGIMAYIGKKLNIPFTYRVATDISADGRYKKTIPKHIQLFFRYGLKNSQAIICQNNYQYENLKKKFPNKKISIIHNPYYYEGVLPQIKKHTERKYIAWMAIFKYQKNLPALYECVKKLPDIEFRIAGTAKASGYLDEKTRMALDALKKCENANFVGYVKRFDVIPFLSEAYALLNTSHIEGFSNTFLESFAAGTPIVTTQRVDPDNIIANNNLGNVANDYSEIPELLTSLFKDKNYNNIAQRCRNYVTEKHNTKILAQQFIREIS